jgi:secondary thiamine-phosphate synthase enzyme
LYHTTVYGVCIGCAQAIGYKGLRAYLTGEALAQRPGEAATSNSLSRAIKNWDESVQRDVVNLLRKLIPKGVWLHDAQDGNGDAHLKSGIVGPSETIPVVDGRLGLSRWQNLFFCEFDGPRSDRRVLCTLIADRD